MDAAGHVLSETHSNGLITNYLYDPATNFLTDIHTIPSQALAVQEAIFPGENKTEKNEWTLKTGGATKKVSQSKSASLSNESSASVAQDLMYSYDVLGNVTVREDGLLNLEDTYQYDDLNRLTKAQTLDRIHGHSTTLNYSYDDLGNITSKSDVGIYSYSKSNAGPHAVTSITGRETDNFTYDAAGNQTEAVMQTSQGTLTRNISYTSFDVPKAITQTNSTTNASGSVAFYYDA